MDRCQVGRSSGRNLQMHLTSTWGFCSRAKVNRGGCGLNVVPGADDYKIFLFAPPELRCDPFSLLMKMYAVARTSQVWLPHKQSICDRISFLQTKYANDAVSRYCFGVKYVLILFSRAQSIVMLWTYCWYSMITIAFYTGRWFQVGWQWFRPLLW